jgi:hypothetical protein
VVNAMPWLLYPLGKRADNHCTWGWVGPRVGLDGCGKFHRQPGFDPRTVQRVTDRCTYCAIPAHI